MSRPYAGGNPGDLTSLLSQATGNSGSSGGSPSGSPYDLGSLLDNYGISPNSLSGAGGGQIGPQTQIMTGWSKYATGPSGTGAGATQTYGTIQDLLNKFYSLWSEGKAGSIVSALESHGLVRPGATVDEVAQVYQNVLEMTARMNQAGNDVTWQDVLSKWGQGTAGPGGGKPSVYTTRQSQVNLTDPDQANALLVQSLQERLGRDPSAAEKQAFLSSLHAYERENPSVTKTTYKLNSAGSYDTSSSTSGGVNPNAFTSTYSTKHNQKEFGAYQAATTYMNALMQAMGSTV